MSRKPMDGKAALDEKEIAVPKKWARVLGKQYYYGVQPGGIGRQVGTLNGLGRRIRTAGLKVFSTKNEKMGGGDVNRRDQVNPPKEKLFTSGSNGSTLRGTIWRQIKKDGGGGEIALKVKEKHTSARGFRTIRIMG